MSDVAFVPRFVWCRAATKNTQGFTPGRRPMPCPTSLHLGSHQQISLSNWGWVFWGGLDSCSGLRQWAPKKMESTQLEVACVLENMIISLGVIPSQDAIRHDTDVSKQKDPKKLIVAFKKSNISITSGGVTHFLKHMLDIVRHVRRVFSAPHAVSISFSECCWKNI